MNNRLVVVMAALLLLPAALLGAGCGGDDSSGDDATSPAAEAAEKAKDLGVPTDADALKDKCVEEFTQSGRSESEAEKLCTVPDDAEIDAQVDKLVKDCLEVAKSLPDGDVQEQAEKDCRESGQ
jgi:hypothetical protein